MKLFHAFAKLEDEPSLEAEVRAVLRQTVVPPSTPEHLRYRVMAMDAATVPAARRGLPGFPARVARRHRIVVGFAGSAMAILLVAAVGFIAVRSRLTTSAGSPEPSGAVWQEGAVMVPQMLPNGAAFTYVDGHGLYLTTDFGATWVGPRQIPPAGNAQDHLWDMGTIEFADSEHGWMTRVQNGADTSIVEAFRTVDGALSWQPVSIATYARDASGHQFVGAQQHFTDLNRGWLLVARMSDQDKAACQRWTTTDGGRTWAGPVDAACTGLTSSAWVTPSVGYVPNDTSAEGALYTTVDGGVQWRRSTLGGAWANPEIELLTSDGDTMTAVIHEWTSTGTPVIADTVMVSRDGGSTWSSDHELGAPDQRRDVLSWLGAFNELSAPQPGRWVATANVEVNRPPCPSGTCYQGSTYQLVESTDEGRTWRQLDGQALYDPSGLAWWDGQHGLVLAERGTPEGAAVNSDRSRALHVTSDGGKTWSLAPF
jgi:photosystem II stability/assembly factor-like uncharacterized protein